MCDYIETLLKQAISEFPLPLFQNESKRETFHMKISFRHKFIQMQIMSYSFSYKRFCTWTRFEKEAEGNLEMAYRSGIFSLKFGFQSQITTYMYAGPFDSP